jgi:hypothetical protein
MPLQNRVDPWGGLQAVEARGAWMGNRGVLHDASRAVVRPWRSKAWILCRLEFKGRRRVVFAPGRYSELFFLDEATAFAAGHRPCAECNRERFLEFKRAWLAGNSALHLSPGIKAADIDGVLHAQRVAGAAKLTYEARLDELPDGAMIEQDGIAYLIRGGALYPWSFAGYGAPLPRRALARAHVLTPRSMVGAIGHGLSVEIHRSVDACRMG